MSILSKIEHIKWQHYVIFVAIGVMAYLAYQYITSQQSASANSTDSSATTPVGYNYDGGAASGAYYAPSGAVDTTGSASTGSNATNDSGTTTYYGSAPTGTSWLDGDPDAAAILAAEANAAGGGSAGAGGQNQSAGSAISSSTTQTGGSPAKVAQTQIDPATGFPVSAASYNIYSLNEDSVLANKETPAFNRQTPAKTTPTLNTPKPGGSNSTQIIGGNYLAKTEAGDYAATATDPTGSTSGALTASSAAKGKVSTGNGSSLAAGNGKRHT